MILKTFFNTPVWSLIAGMLPGRSYAKTLQIPSDAHYFYASERIVRADLINLSELPPPFIDSLNNSYDVPDRQYELPIVFGNDKATIYFPYFKEDFKYTIHDVLLDVDCELNVYYLDDDPDKDVFGINVTGTTVGDIVLKALPPDFYKSGQEQGNNPAIGDGDLNFDRAIVSSNGSRLPYSRLQVKPDFTLRRIQTNQYGMLCSTTYYDGEFIIQPFFDIAKCDYTFAAINKYYGSLALQTKWNVQNQWYFEEQEESGSGSGSGSGAGS